MPSPVRPLLGTLRLPFLLLTPACVALGLACAWRSAGGTLRWADAAGVLLGALAAHASVNVLNEWHDFRSGLDARTLRTPFSGGSGALPAQPAAAGAALALGLALLAVAGGIGLWLLARQGPALLPLGLAGLALVVAYTPWITRRPLLCLLAPGLGFGPLMVVGTQLALTGRHGAAVWAASLLPWCLVNGLLLLNQFPDVEADRSVGRRHLPMLLGRPRAARLFVAQLALAYALTVAAVVTGLLPAGALLALLTLPLAVSTARAVLRHADDIPALLPALGRNVALTLATPLLMAAGLLLS